MAKYLTCDCGWKTRIPHNQHGAVKRTQDAYKRLVRHTGECKPPETPAPHTQKGAHHE